MPIYEDENTTREDLLELCKRNKCKECGARLDVLWDMKRHKAYLTCHLDQSHEGIEREASRYEKGGLSELTIKTRREIMEQEHGVEKTKALAKYVSVGTITKAIATEIVETLWSGAPPIEKTKAIILCQTYQLNPLMKHLYLVGYKRRGPDKKFIVGRDGKPILDWSMMIGIGATRLMAQRKHNYSYLDMTPRKATRMEIDTVLGDTADPNSVYGFVHIKDVDTGAEAFGLRGIPKDENIKGRDKGNTHLNQACVRAERLALDRQYPGEMPSGDVEVVDERFMEDRYRDVDGKTGEIIEGEAEEVEEGLDYQAEHMEHWCREHNCPFELKKSRYGQFYSHKKPDGTYCKEGKQEKKKKEAAPAAEEVPETAEPEPEAGVEESQQPKRDPETITTINELYKACNEDFKLQPDQVIKELGVSSQTDISDTPAECYRRISAVR